MRKFPFIKSNKRKNQRISLLSFVKSDCMLSDNVAVGYLVKLKNVTIGKYSYIANNSHLVHVKIGAYCSIGPFVKIGLGKHPINHFSSSPLFYSEKNPFGINDYIKTEFEEHKEVIIKNDVWIGANAIILDGVIINDGAIVAAGAVVTKDVQPYSIVAGVPAKPIKNRFEDKKIEELVKSKWWENDPADINF